MILRRVLSMVVDVVSSLLPALAAHWVGLNFISVFIVLYLLTQLGEILYLQGRTVGMILCKIRPQNRMDQNVGLAHIIFYHIVLVVIVINFLNPLMNIYSRILFPSVLVLPFYDTKKYNSVLDLIFRIHWTNEPLSHK